MNPRDWNGALEMNLMIIWRLVLKDWYLHRVAVALILFGMSLGVALSAASDNSAQSIGLSLILSMLSAMTFYLPLSTVLSERTEKTLPFVLSLPVSLSDYTTAKIVANVSIYLIPLAAVAVGSRLVFHYQLSLTLGLTTYHFYVLLLGMLVSFSFVLGFSLITESMGWTVALIVTLMFLVGNVLTQLLPRVPAARQFFSDIAQGKSEFFIALGAELVTILFLLALTYLIQIRKRNFL